MMHKKWWQKTTIYQIYPRSFMDSNQDGIGDLPGIISKLDYIQQLGFETIWISPFFRSPQADWGYDVSDYYDIAPEYGNLQDAERLIEEVHRRDMRILFDLVLSHSSDQHPWFKESRSSKENPKRDWYIWRDGRGSKPPTNWQAIPGGSGWHYDERTDQWYYASFLPFQPDLNYRNPEVREEMFKVVRYWLDKGVDGFRLDIFHCLFKDKQFRDNPFSTKLLTSDHSAGFFQQWKYTVNQPETFEHAKQLRSLIDSYTPDRVLIGELFGDPEVMRSYLGEALDGLNLVFLWDLVDQELDASFLRQVLHRYETIYPEPYTPVYLFGNHDLKRLFSKMNGDIPKVKLLALLQFTARGVPVTYYGEEIGMSDVSIPAREAKDPVGRRYRWVPKFLTKLLHLYFNRDGCRTPMQWDNSPHAGFCPQTVQPWLPVHEDYERVNVKAQESDPQSLLNTYKTLLKLRNESSVLQEGTLRLLEGSGEILAYLREVDEDKMLILLNFGDVERTYENYTDCRREKIQVGQVSIKEAVNIRMEPLSGIVLST
jgi:oligo-1,6-glucosidase/alpha-glucosidase